MKKQRCRQHITRPTHFTRILTALAIALAWSSLGWTQEQGHSSSEPQSTAGLVRTFQGHTDAVWSVTFSPDGKYALSGSDDKTLRLWDIRPWLR